MAQGADRLFAMLPQKQINHLGGEAWPGARPFFRLQDIESAARLTAQPENLALQLGRPFRLSLEFAFGSH
jgi:hypothetical protein